MKKPSIPAAILAVLFLASAHLFARQPLAASAQFTPYAEVARGPHQRVIQRVAPVPDASGEMVYHTNSYMELATGMSVLRNGQWVPASTAIQIVNGGALAGGAQHGCFFAANLNTANAIQVTLPNGGQMQGVPMFLSYFDGQHVKLIAELRDSIGQVLPSGNQVLYTNAFGSLADVKYDFRLDGLAQDIVLRTGLPDPPADFGGNILLQVWTEFAVAPSPQRQSFTNRNNGLVDEVLDFGSMRMTKGIAFLAGDNQPLTPTYKHWRVLNGRTFLVEEVPLAAIAGQLAQLPPYVAASPGSAGTNSASSLAKLEKADSFKLPPPKAPRNSTTPMLLALEPGRRSGLVLDYDLINSTQTNMVFQSDTTYLITNTVNLYGATTFEGQTVIKFPPYHGQIVINGSNVICPTAPYRCVSLTASDDDTVGAQISGSSGSPSTYSIYGVNSGPSGAVSLNFQTIYPAATTLKNFRFSNLCLPISYDGDEGILNLYDCQFNYCDFALTQNGSTINFYLYNTLFCNILNAVYYEPVSAGGCPSLNCQNVTMRNCGNAMMPQDGHYFSDDAYCNTASLNLLNCLLAGTGTNQAGLNISAANSVILASDSGVFQSVGAGGNYLASGSPYTNSGTTSGLDATLLAELAQKTVCPPILLTSNITSDTLLVPQAFRDSSATPALGYHYDCLDFLLCCAITNATLTLNNGVAVGYYNFGVWLQNSTQLVSAGTPTAHNVIAYYELVQEQSSNLVSGVSAASALYNSAVLNAYQASITQNPNVSLRSTDLIAPQGAEYCLVTLYTGTSAMWAINNLTLRDCEMYGAGAMFYMKQFTNSQASTAILLENNLFHRTYAFFFTCAQLTTHNNLFWGTNNAVRFLIREPAVWTNANNAFDGVAILSLDPSFVTNAYLNGVNYATTYTGDIVANLTWQTGPLGNYYQPSGSPLLNQGSAPASALGLYAYTTVTSQVPERTNTVTIGLHYPALTNILAGPPAQAFTSNGHGTGPCDVGAWYEVLYDDTMWLDGSAGNGGIIPYMPMCPNSITFSGTGWQYVLDNSGSYTNNDYHITHANGDLVRFKFTGTGIRVLGMASGGTFGVLVKNEVGDTNDCFIKTNSGSSGPILYSNSFSSLGNYTITITNSAAYLGIDAFEVANTYNATGLTWKTIDDNDDFGEFRWDESGDPSIIDYHLSQLASSGIDYILIDQSNGEMGGYPNMMGQWSSGNTTTDLFGRTNSQILLTRLKAWNDTNQRQIKYAFVVGDWWTIYMPGVDPAVTIANQVADIYTNFYLNQQYGGPDNYYHISGNPLLVVHGDFFGWSTNGEPPYSVLSDYYSTHSTSSLPTAWTNFALRMSWADVAVYTDYITFNGVIYGATNVSMFGWHPSTNTVNPLVTNSHEMELLSPGHNDHTQVAASRDYGAYYSNSWNVILGQQLSNSLPQMLVIESFNEYLEDDAIWAADSGTADITNAPWTQTNVTKSGDEEWFNNAINGPMGGARFFL